MAALLAFRPREAAPPPPHNDNISAWQGFNAVPSGKAAHLAEDVLALRLSRNPLLRLAGFVLGALSQRF